MHILAGFQTQNKTVLKNFRKYIYIMYKGRRIWLSIFSAKQKARRQWNNDFGIYEGKLVWTSNSISSQNTNQVWGEVKNIFRSLGLRMITCLQTSFKKLEFLSWKVKKEIKKEKHIWIHYSFAMKFLCNLFK